MNFDKASAHSILAVLLSGGAGFTMNGGRKVHRFQFPFHEMRTWGKRKRERFSELIELGKSVDEAFDIVEHNQGIIPETNSGGSGVAGESD